MKMFPVGRRSRLITLCVEFYLEHIIIQEQFSSTQDQLQW